jgi:hypothetical protein
MFSFQFFTKMHTTNRDEIKEVLVGKNMPHALRDETREMTIELE